MKRNDLRDRIDGIDEELVRLLNERARIAAEMGKIKEDSRTPAYNPAREREVLRHVEKLNDGPLPARSVEAIYREIMSASAALEKRTAVAYLGPQATFTHQAARDRFGGSVDYTPCESIGDVFAAVEKGTADHGVVPIENSIHGPEARTLDCLVDSALKICAETVLPISHCLLSQSPLPEITRIYSHPQALAQCRRWLRMEMPSAELVPAASTAKAAEVAGTQKGAAALAGSLAAEMYGLDTLACGIEDMTGNRTRFVILARSSAEPTGNDKTSIVFSVKHHAGSLYSALASFSRFGLNMTKIESRPARSHAWEYNFFVDFEGHSTDPTAADALKDLLDHCTFLTVLGSYPKAERNTCGREYL
jgi:chorismate mutase/prephenate dehydratase